MKKFLSFILAFALAALTALGASAAEPRYEFSAAYISSEYYTRLIACELSGDARDDIVAIAETQLGYHEGNSEADMHGGNTSGKKNFVEYNRMYGKLDNGEGNGMSYGYAWCAAFVSWCLRHADIPETAAISEVSCPRMLNYLNGKGRYYDRASGYIPQKGDLIFFSSSGNISDHIGIVTGVLGDTVHTIEGNHDGVVGRFTYPLGDSYIKGYGIFATDPGEFFVSASTAVYSDGGELIKTLEAGSFVQVSEIKGARGKIALGDSYGWAEMSLLLPVEFVSFTVTYDAGDGKNCPDPQIKKLREEMKITEDSPTLKGARFLGWSTEPNDGTAEYAPGDVYNENQSLTLYAVWEAAKYSIRFLNPDGGVISEKIYAFGDKIEIPQSPEMPSDKNNRFVFEKWDVTVQKYCIGEAVYTAVYTAIPLTDEEKAQLLAQETTAARADGCSSFASAGTLASLIAVALILKKGLRH
jgi:hypothetical protein